MPPVLPNPADRMLAGLGRTANMARALATQPNLTLASPSGQVAINTGQLQQYPTSGTNFTTGYGLEVLSAGSGSAPVARGGILSWTSPTNGTITVTGLAFFDGNGALRVLWDSHGETVYDASGNVVSTPISY